MMLSVSGLALHAWWALRWDGLGAHNLSSRTAELLPDSCSVVVCCHNEAPRIAGFHRALQPALNQAATCGVKMNVVAVNHGSTDGTAEALESLKRDGYAFGCICTRKDLALTAVNGLYPGTCKAGLPPGEKPRSWRFDMPKGVQSWEDRGRGLSRVAGTAMGDFVLKRADGHWAYHLAVVVDDADQDVTHVVRGADLWTSTAAHMALQRAMNLPSPEYVHVPLVTNDLGQKLSKQTQAQPVERCDAATVLAKALQALGQTVPDLDEPQVMLEEAVASWDVLKIRNKQVS